MPKKRILVVEDDTDLRETLQQLLELEGYPVTVAENGEVALKILKSEPAPGLVLLDFMMPLMNGGDCLEAIRKMDHFLELPVFLLSAAGERANSPKATGSIRKPVELSDLLQIAEKYCTA
ncbi:MAG: response regulator [Bdellovibrionota bacterium]